MRPYTILIFDADGTLRRTLVPGQPCPNAQDEWALMPHVQTTLARYQWKTAQYFGIVSNQGGIEAHLLTAQRCTRLLETLAAAATGWWWPWDVLRFCPHLPATSCGCRKPSGQLIREVCAYWRAAGVTGPCLYVGDQASDQEAARDAGVDFAWSQAFFGTAAVPPYRQEEIESSLQKGEL